MNSAMAWVVVAAILGGLITMAGIVDRPTLDLKRPTRGAVALIAVTILLLMLLVIASAITIFG